MLGSHYARTVKLLNPPPPHTHTPVVYANDRSMVGVLVFFLFCVALCVLLHSVKFMLSLTLLFVLMFSVLFSIVITLLLEERAGVTNSKPTYLNVIVSSQFGFMS